MEENFKEEARKKLKVLDEKRVGNLLATNITLKKLKKAYMTSKLAAALLVGAVAGEKVGEVLNQPQVESSVYDDMKTISFAQADDDVIIDYMNDSYAKYGKYVDNWDAESAKEAKDTMWESFYAPVMQAYDDYKYSNDEADHKLFKQRAAEYERRVGQVHDSFKFDKSIFKYAKSIDGEVCVPYTGIIDDSTIPSNAHIIDRVVYIPANSLTEEETKTLGND